MKNTGLSEQLSRGAACNAAFIDQPHRRQSRPHRLLWSHPSLQRPSSITIPYHYSLFLHSFSYLYLSIFISLSLYLSISISLYLSIYLSLALSLSSLFQPFQRIDMLVLDRLFCQLHADCIIIVDRGLSDTSKRNFVSFRIRTESIFCNM